MRSEIKVTNAADVAVIDIEGVIGVPERMQFERPQQRVATYERFTEALGEIRALDAAQVIVNIRSTGGEVNDALLIYDALAALEGTVITRCMGYVASAATIIAQAASPGCREISSNTLYLIHCSESSAEGNSRAMGSTTQMLEATDSRIAGIYAARSGRPAEEFAALMNENAGRGRWLSAEETVAAGLADKVTGAGENTSVNFAELDSTLDMLGLSCLPPGAGNTATRDGASVREKLVRLWHAVLRMLGGATAAKSNDRVQAGGEAGKESAVSSGGLPRDRSVVMERRTAQDTAMPTTVKAVEDPSMGEYRRTANEQAYENDASGFINA